MKSSHKISPFAAFLTLFLFFSVTFTTRAQDDIIAFDSEKWTLVSGEIVEYLGRKALAGAAVLNDVEFENGVIEFDLAVTGQSGYPGVSFRVQSPDNYENFYIRPHRGGLYPDALQYTPHFNGVSGWQLYNGEGFTAGYDFPENEWMHFKLEICGSQARVFIDSAAEPVLIIHELKHGPCRGGISLTGGRKDNAYFSNFRYRSDDHLVFDPPPQPVPLYGIIRDWEITAPFVVNDYDLEIPYNRQDLNDLTWQKVIAEPSGLVDISRYVKFGGRFPEFVWARTIISAGQDELRELSFGYSDGVCIFINGELIFSGASGYRQRDPSFAGIIGYNDAVYLPLIKGDNELLLSVFESFGGWGFMACDADAVFEHEKISKSWELRKDLRYPESVTYDPKRDMLYVSNYYSGIPRGEFISRLNPDGRMVQAAWITELDRPLGLKIYEDRLYAVERTALAEIDIDSGRVVHRYPFPSPQLPNDLAIDSSGGIYVSDTRRSVIYKLNGDNFEVWLETDEISGPNGLACTGTALLVGNTGDGAIKTVDLNTRETAVLVKLGDGSGTDGLIATGDGDFLASDYTGRLYRITPDGVKTLLLDTSAGKTFLADFAYIEKQGLLVVPTFQDNRVIAYRLEK